MAIGLRNLRSITRDCATACAARAASVATRWLGDRSRERVGILMYHRIVAPVAGFTRPTWNVPPTAFRAQLTGLLERGYRAISLRDLVRLSQHVEAPPARSFAVTFDDGYVNFYSQAWPILRELQIPVTLFLPTAYIGRPEKFPFDNWSDSGRAPAEMWRGLTWDECRELAADPLMEFGAHTHCHRDYSGQPQAFREDIARCREILRRELNIERPSFAFPYGAFDTELLRAVREENFTCVLSTVARLVDTGSPTWPWHRFAMYEHDTAATIAGRLSGWLERFIGPFARRQRQRLAACDRVRRDFPLTPNPSSRDKKRGAGTPMVESNS